MTSADASRRYVFPVDAQQLEDTPQEYKQRMRKVAAEALAAAASIARNVKVSYQ
jgi:hypothetical protein